MISDNTKLDQHQRRTLTGHLKKVLPAMGIPRLTIMEWQNRFKGCQILELRSPQLMSKAVMTCGEVGSLHICSDMLYNKLSSRDFILAVRKSATCAGDIQKYVKLKGTSKYKTLHGFLEEFFEEGESGTHVWSYGFKASMTPEEWADAFDLKYEFHSKSEAISCLVNAMYKDEEKQVFHNWVSEMREAGKYSLSAYNHHIRAFIPLWKDEYTMDSWLEFFVTEGDMKIKDLDLSYAEEDEVEDEF